MGKDVRNVKILKGHSMKKSIVSLLELVIFVIALALVACSKTEPSSVELKVGNWGPQSTVVKNIPNQGPDGNAGIWIEVSGVQGLGEVQVLFSGKPANKTVVQPKLITAAIGPENFTQVGNKEIAIKQVSTGKVFHVGMFNVESAK
jgi:hypothetical protein